MHGSLNLSQCLIASLSMLPENWPINKAKGPGSLSKKWKIAKKKKKVKLITTKLSTLTWCCRSRLTHMDKKRQIDIESAMDMTEHYTYTELGSWKGFGELAGI